MIVRLWAHHPCMLSATTWIAGPLDAGKCWDWRGWQVLGRLASAGTGAAPRLGSLFQVDPLRCRSCMRSTPRALVTPAHFRAPKSCVARRRQPASMGPRQLIRGVQQILLILVFAAAAASSPSPAGPAAAAARARPLSLAECLAAAKVTTVTGDDAGYLQARQVRRRRRRRGAVRTASASVHCRQPLSTAPHAGVQRAL